jgi:hypothetical protein
MPNHSFARALLRHWGVTVEDIPTSEKKEADFLASFNTVRVLIEEKTKEDDPDYLDTRAKELEKGEIHAAAFPLVRNETLSGIIRNASNQLRSSSDTPHDFRLLWFTATGVQAQAKYEQFMSTLYGRTNIVEMGTNTFRRCYYFRNADFFRRAGEIDGAVAAYTDDTSITAKLCLNSLSPNYLALQQSSVIRHFASAVEDPVELEASGGAMILDTDLNRKDEGPLLSYLQSKYKTRPLMTFDLGYTSASVLVAKDEF